MTPEQFLQFADPLPEPMLLLTTEGLILAGNAAILARLGLSPAEVAEHPLADFVEDSPEETSRYLKLCSRSRSMVLGGFEIRAGDRGPISCRAEGALLQPQMQGQPGLLLLRLMSRESSVGRFVALNHQIEELSREVQRRRQAEMTAREQAERLRVTLSSIGDGVIVTDAAGCIVSLNPVAEALTGWSNEQARGQPLEPVFEIINESTREAVENPATRALHDGVIVGLANHTILISRDGSETPIADSAAPIRDDRGNVIGVVLVFRDVAEQRRAEQEVRFQARLLDAVGQAVIATDSDGTIIFWNPFATTLYGWSREEAIGQSIHELIMAPTSAAHEKSQTVIARLRAGQSWAGELQVKNRDGIVFSAGVTNTPVFDAKGKLYAIIGVSADMTDRIRVVQGLRFLADASASLAVIDDFESTLQKVAGLAVPLFADCCSVDMIEADGSVRRSALVHHDAANIPPTSQIQQLFPYDPEAEKGVARVLRTGHSELLPDILSSSAEHEQKPDAHQRLWSALGLRSSICVPLEERGHIRGAITFAAAESRPPYSGDDVAFAEELARRAGIALENTRLYAELRETDRRKDEFLATLAHELRNPLAPIRHGLQVMRLSGSQDGVVGQAQVMMERQLSHLVRLVDDLLDVSRITRNRIELLLKRVDLASVIHSAVETSRPLIEQSAHTLSVTVPEDPIYVEADLTRLAQVFANLLNNSAKYTEPGGQIALTTEVAADEVVVRVSDTGLGIPPESLSRIFDMFSQVDGTMERSQGGLGIGLTLVRRLVELHGGTVHAHSAGIGRGSEFSVRLPVMKATPALQATGGAGSVAEPAPKRRILVVDDNRDAALSLSTMLRLMGNETRAAFDGLAALDVTSEFQPNIILLDIGMPKLNGYDTCRRIREQPGSEEIMIVALTGWGQEEDRRRSLAAGFDHHMVKPVEIAALEKLLSDTRSSRKVQ